MNNYSDRPGPLRIAVTGGIGTGKSAVARVFAGLGAELFEADVVAKEVMATEPRLRAALVAAFGTAAYAPDGSLDRRFLASRAFGDPEELRTLNGLVHPFVQERLDAALAACPAPVFVMEAALVYETGIETKFDYIVVVDADEETRIARTVARTGATAEEVRRRMVMQMPQRDKVDAADFVLRNTGTLAELERAATDLYHLLALLPRRHDAPRS